LAIPQKKSHRTSWTASYVALALLLLACVYMAKRISASPPPRQVNVPDTPATQPPICGKPNDELAHLPPDWETFTPPAVGGSYIDQVFGCSVERITDSSREDTLSDGTHANFSLYYSTFTPMNAADSMLMLGTDDGSWLIRGIDGKDLVPAGKLPPMNNGHPLWDAKDGNVFYYTRDNALYKASVKGHSADGSVLYTFKEYSGIVSPDAADLSQDGDHIALVGERSGGAMDIFVWSLSKQAKTSTYATKCAAGQWNVSQAAQPGCIHKIELTPDNLLSIQFADDGSGPEQGVRLWKNNQLIHLQDGTNHYDTGENFDGRPIFIEMGRSSTLSSDDNPCPGGWGLDVRELADLSSASCLLDKQPSWHVSYRGSAAQPWAALSFFDVRKDGPEIFNHTRGYQAPSMKNWEPYEDEIVLARIDGDSTYRLAQARSRSAENYWAQPRAAISRDGKYVIFSSSMAYAGGCPVKMHVVNECTDVYLIKAH
jgi:hypothetical protein